MKILYGVQGTGNGHIARARAMAYALKEKNLDVTFFFSGREKERYFSMEEFGNFDAKKGITFATDRGKVNYFKTTLDCAPLDIWHEIKQLNLSGYDLVLNDFEPISAWAAKRQNVPCIGISHQNAFKYEIPKKGESWLDSQIIRHFAPSDFHIGLHWYHFGQPILPPIVHTIKSQTVKSGCQVLVYLPFERVSDIAELLLRFTSTQFVCFHPDIEFEQVIENIDYRKPSHLSFQKELHQCHGIIANGGFELPSEALSLGKKLLLKPLSGQFEQESNVATLEHLGLAYSMDYLDPSAVRNWLDAGQAENVRYPDVAVQLVDWIEKGHWHSTEKLRKTLWEQVDFPSYAVV